MMYWVSMVSDSMSTVLGLRTMAAVSSFLTLRRTEQIWEMERIFLWIPGCQRGTSAAGRCTWRSLCRSEKVRMIEHRIKRICLWQSIQVEVYICQIITIYVFINFLSFDSTCSKAILLWLPSKTSISSTESSAAGFRLPSLSQQGIRWKILKILLNYLFI